MSLELYTGYLSLGGNEIINNERTRGILEGVDCPVDWFRDDDERCPTLQNALFPPLLTPWADAAVNLATNPSFETSDGAGGAATVTGNPAHAGEVTQSTAWAASGTDSIRISPNTPGSSDTYAQIGFSGATLTALQTPGKAFTVVATARMTGPQSGSVDARARRIVVDWAGDAFGAQMSEPFNDADGEFELRWTFEVPAGAVTLSYLRLYNGAAPGGGDVWFDNFLLVEVPSVELPYTGPYFDGSTPNEDNALVQHLWDGATDASTSTMQTRELITAPSFAELSVASAPWYDLDIPGPSGDFYGAYALSIESVSNSTRQASISEGILNGGTIGRQRLSTRTIRVQAMLFARNSAGLEYGRSWLDSATQPGACGQHGTRCGVTDLEFLVDCPPSLEDYPPDGAGYNADVDALVRFMHAAQVTSGPFTVQEFQFERSEFVAQIVEFSITSERAFIYGRTRTVELPTSDSVVVQDVPFNLVPYPSAELPGADVVIARNLSTNPSVEVNATAWTMAAAAVSGTAPAAYFTTGRSTDIAAAGTASMRGRILGNGSTEVAASVAKVTATQDVTLGAQPAGTRYSVTIWGAGLVSAGAAVTSVSAVVATLEWLNGSAAVIDTVPLGSAATPAEIQGRVYSANSLLPPAGAVTARAKLEFTVGWRSSATAANNSDARLYADALAITIP